MLVLKFLPVLLGEKAFDELIECLSTVIYTVPKLINLLIYYRNYWINSIKALLFNIQKEHHSTNNALISWHARFNKVIGRQHPNIFMLY